MSKEPKTIDTLIEDIYEILESDEDFSLDSETLARFGLDICENLQGELKGKRRDRKDRVLYASEIGKPCTRQIAYSIDPTYKPEPLEGSTKIKFQYGHIIEALILALAKAAGHEVTHEQEEFEHELYNGWRIRGRSDAVIDGVMVDVKSASTFAFNKYKKEGIHDGNDNFGYRHQVLFYADEADLDRIDPKLLMIDKQLGKINLVDVPYTSGLYKEAKNKTNALQIYNDTGVLPAKLHDAEVPEGKSGNMKLCTTCSYCAYKKDCHPGLRTFAYTKGPVFLTKVVREPNVHEITE